MSKKINKRTKLKKRFEDRGFGVVAYAKAFGFEPPYLRQLLNGRLDKNAPKVVLGREVYGFYHLMCLKLKEDGLLIGLLPWEDNFNPDMDFGYEES
jgi:hypothetical protein